MEIQRFAAYGMIAISILLSYILQFYCGLDFAVMFWTLPTVFLAAIAGFLGGLTLLIDAIYNDVIFYIKSSED
jgi:hypothetical protein